MTIATIALIVYGLFLRETWNLPELKFSLRTFAVLTPLFVVSAQFFLYFGVHMWTFFKYN
jgi:hypothetical protein